MKTSNMFNCMWLVAFHVFGQLLIKPVGVNYIEGQPTSDNPTGKFKEAVSKVREATKQMK